MTTASWPLTRTLEVSWTLNAMGGTDVTATYNGTPAGTVTLDGYNIDAQGLDQVKNQIESLVGGIIDQALQAFT